MQLAPESYGNLLSDFLRAYYLLPDHPSKLRILGWIESLAGRKRIAVKTKSGFRFAVDRRDYIQKTVFLRREWEPEIEGFLRTQLKETDVFFDIGANVGYFTLVALCSRVDKVFAFEPNPELQEIMLLNLRLSGWGDHPEILVKSGLSDTSGRAIYQTGPLENSGIGRIVNTEHQSTFAIDTITLDSFIEETGVLPTVLKIDVEGHESKVLHGAKRLFERNPPRLVVFEADCNENCDITDKEVIAFFKMFSYNIRHLPRQRPETKENYVASLAD
jgi:FkbM family methyltransferase